MFSDVCPFMQVHFLDVFIVIFFCLFFFDVLQRDANICVPMF